MNWVSRCAQQTRVEHNVSTIQLCVARWIQKGLRLTEEEVMLTNQRIYPLTIGNLLSKSPDIWRQLPQGAYGAMSTQAISSRLRE
ncbi:hypothetical protein TNCV_4889721 [Trichonephila clavipes]|nr:hypothetical protein TNCV_4889721 [Trichonephila clavipes]